MRDDLRGFPDPSFHESDEGLVRFAPMSLRTLPLIQTITIDTTTLQLMADPLNIGRLPPELMSNVMSFFTADKDSHTLAQIRLVCNEWAAIAKPHLLCNIFLGSFTNKSRPMVKQLEELASGEAAASRLARNLFICYKDAFPVHSRVLSTLEKGMLKHLSKAISSLQRVEKVVWDVGSKETEWIHNCILESLSSLPQLKQLVMYNCSSLKQPAGLGRFSNLQHVCLQGLHFRSSAYLAKLITQSPELTQVELDISSYHSSVSHHAPQPYLNPNDVEHALPLRSLLLRGVALKPQFLAPTFTRHLRQIHRLELVNLMATESPSVLWQLLVAGHVQDIKYLRIDAVLLPGLHHFLASFHGLKSLDILERTSYTPDPVDISGTEILQALSSHHSDTLEELCLPPRLPPFSWPPPDPWPDHALGLSSLQNFCIWLLPTYLYNSTPADNDRLAREAVKSLVEMVATHFLSLKTLMIRQVDGCSTHMPPFLCPFPQYWPGRQVEPERPLGNSHYPEYTAVESILQIGIPKGRREAYGFSVATPCRTYRLESPDAESQDTDLVYFTEQ